MIRVACYIDGFNFYHSLDDMNRRSGGTLNYLKWVDLGALMSVYTDKAVHQIVAVKYFSAYATWKPDSHARHQLYVQALNQAGVEVILGRFKEKDVFCKACRGTFRAHEEKESDVNLATHLMADAFENRFDHAYVVTRDSDLAGPIRMVRRKHPAKKVKVIAPPQRRHSKELWALADLRAEIKEEHLKQCLLPQTVTDTNGAVVCTRPPEYDP